MITREIVQQALNAYDDLGAAVAALVADYPDCEAISPLHGISTIQSILQDLDSYAPTPSN